MTAVEESYRRVPQVGPEGRPRAFDTWEIPRVLDPLDGRGTLQEQVMRSLRGAVVVGRLRVGGRVPSIFQMKEYFGVSRVTVTSAVNRLIDREEVLARAGNRGTFVRRVPRTR